jgi:hypothetical protein
MENQIEIEKRDRNRGSRFRIGIGIKGIGNARSSIGIDIEDGE